MTATVDQPALLFDFEVHPAAAAFPMLGDDELRDLAADIKANGLLHPIVLDKDGVLIDGRNRLAACNLAGVQPTTITLPDGLDPLAYILSENVRRRHLNKGQQAMAIAMMLDLSKGRTGGRALTLETKVSEARVSQAVTVLKYTPDLAPGVLDGSRVLDAAYEQARKRKDAASSREAQMARLRREAPDLADLVVEERLELADALSTAERRAQRELEARTAATKGLLQAVRLLGPPSGDVVEHARNLMARFDPDLVPGAQEITPARLDICIAFLTAARADLVERATAKET